MFNKKKTECRVCGYRFTPERENIYTAEEPRSALEMLTAALVSYAVVNGRKCGRTTDYMKDGKGYPLNYCPSCGKRVKNE